MSDRDSDDDEFIPESETQTQASDSQEPEEENEPEIKTPQSQYAFQDPNYLPRIDKYVKVQILIQVAQLIDEGRVEVPEAIVRRAGPRGHARTQDLAVLWLKYDRSSIPLKVEMLGVPLGQAVLSDDPPEDIFEVQPDR